MTYQVFIESIKSVITDNNHQYPNSTAILVLGRQNLTYKNLSKFTRNIADQQNNYYSGHCSFCMTFKVGASLGKSLGNTKPVSSGFRIAAL